VCTSVSWSFLTGTPQKNLAQNTKRRFDRVPGGRLRPPTEKEFLLRWLTEAEIAKMTSQEIHLWLEQARSIGEL
jgi:hypothetical protein